MTTCTSKRRLYANNDMFITCMYVTDIVKQEDIREIDINKMFKQVTEIPKDDLNGNKRQIQSYYECQVCYCLIPQFQIQIHRKQHENFNVTGDLN